ncbi:hypothetical protein [Neisseria meningitidis]|uniref:hypothetical protein n=1 Tax=Neisseria meningitidis TaxID=487 RepID=UPI00162A357B|nr:hypothetical protein [Neisseria meningitidis]
MVGLVGCRVGFSPPPPPIPPPSDGIGLPAPVRLAELVEWWDWWAEAHPTSTLSPVLCIYLTHPPYVNT